MTIDNKVLLKIIENIAVKVKENKEYLTELDSAIGDGDHGINMDRGFQAVQEKLPALADKDCGTILKTVGITLVSTVGGASGPLYGTAFMRAGGVSANKYELNREDFLEILEAALEGIKMRGKAERGDKTIVDALEPAVLAFRENLQSPNPLLKALEAAREGVDYTKSISAKKGRASYLGDRSIGHQDPGATSCCLMLEALAETLEPQEA
ncbi:dihydroxyacetone kinase-like protein [Desulfohalotomaculum tongense]|uniref:dihydroxyacetone kinase subunit DhaL n=1 Tax=Desulforadius tongensis TaxID=1216062 RepID=UPI00195BB4EF|nr:dihydroxyacetone kinase subunit DhaL [Desulforadius tongensis]MBM7854811.1 dihydroxyacetone kinase-like protein [Desulforadius tongensis]